MIIHNGAWGKPLPYKAGGRDLKHHGAGAFVGEHLYKLNAGCGRRDVGALDAAVNGFGAAFDFRNHSAGDDAVCQQAGYLIPPDYMNKRRIVCRVAEDAAGIRQDDELFGARAMASFEAAVSAFML